MKTILKFLLKKAASTAMFAINQFTSKNIFLRFGFFIFKKIFFKKIMKKVGV